MPVCPHIETRQLICTTSLLLRCCFFIADIGMDHFSKENGVLSQMLELNMTADDEVIDAMLSEILTDMGKDGRYQNIEINYYLSITQVLCFVR